MGPTMNQHGEERGKDSEHPEDPRVRAMRARGGRGSGNVNFGDRYENYGGYPPEYHDEFGMGPDRQRRPPGPMGPPPPGQMGLPPPGMHPRFGYENEQRAREQQQKSSNISNKEEENDSMSADNRQGAKNSTKSDLNDDNNAK